MEFLNPILNPIFGPLLALPSFFAIAIIAFIITLLTTLIYKYATDQDLMKRLKQDQSDMKKKMKEVKHDPEKLQAHQKEMMQKSMELMKHSMKPMLYTFIPVIVLFGWLSANLAYFPLTPGESFTVTVDLREASSAASSAADSAASSDASSDASSASQILNISLKTDLEQVSFRQDGAEGLRRIWELRGAAGTHLLEFHLTQIDQIGQQKPDDYSNSSNTTKQAASASGTSGLGTSSQESIIEHTVLISDIQRYSNPLQQFREGPIATIQVSNAELKPLGTVSLLGWEPGWLGVYIILSLVFNLAIRKVLGVH